MGAEGAAREDLGDRRDEEGAGSDRKRRGILLCDTRGRTIWNERREGDKRKRIDFCRAWIGRSLERKRGRGGYMKEKRLPLRQPLHKDSVCKSI